MMKIQTEYTIKAFAIAGLLALTACGGGGGDSGAATTPLASAQGLWNGSTSASRSVMGIVLDDGSYWLLYGIADVGAVIGGFIQGTGSSLNGSFSSSDAKDFDLPGQSINNATLSASYTTKQSFNGSVSYANLAAPLTFTSSYNPDYDQTPSLSKIAGNYGGAALVANSKDVVSFVISAQGVVAGTGLTSHCQYGGLVVPRAKGNVYDVSLVIDGSACVAGTSAVSGIGYFDSGSKGLYLAAVNKSRTIGMSFSGVKP